MSAPGSKDDRPIKMVDVSAETVLTVLVFPTGKADVHSSMSPEQVRETLLRLADVYRGRESVVDGEVLDVDDHVCGPECAPGPGGSVIPLAFIELTRSEVDGMVADLKKRDPMTTEQLALTFANSHDLDERRHVQALSVMVAILMQRAAYQ